MATHFPMNAQIDILLAIHNADAYLEPQLDSLLNQSCADWGMVASDDDSADGSADILRQYQASYPEKIRLAPREGERLGAVGNFALLLRNSTGEYSMLCDQDDVWLPDKIERTLQKMHELEAAYGKDTPLLVHTDLTVVDDELNIIADSLWRYQRSDPGQGSRLCRLLLQNAATGCTMMINRALRDRALPIPQDAIMHDWWLALTAAAFGHIGYVLEPTVLYRQHGRNDTGARPWNAGHVLRQLADLQSARLTMQRTQTQAAAFLHRFAAALPPHDREMVAAYAGLQEQGFFLKRYNLVKYGFAYSGLLRTIGLFVVV